MRTYRKWHAVIDMVGLAGLLSLLLYWLRGSSTGAVDPELANIWSNLSTELLGAWAAARVIEYAIRKDDEHNRIRVRAARNLRYYLHLSNRCVEFGYRPDIDLFHRERAWSRRFFDQNIACFTKDEASDVHRAYDALDLLGGRIEELAEARRAGLKNVDVDQLKNVIQQAITEYEALAFKAESNIFEETPEMP